MPSVIHFINSFEDAIANLAELLAGKGPKLPSRNHIGTHDYSRPPRAVIFGQAFAAEHVKELHHLYGGQGGRPMAWIAGDPNVVPPEHPGPDYAERAANSVKRVLAEWESAGASNDNIVYY